ncbi:MAG TPA: C13 family peptidase [Caulobacter sp.]|nr:C13 family peptidase [Caulobacter sp.]
MGRGLGVILGLIAALLAPAAIAQTPATPPKSPFNDWSAIVVAGDWRANDGNPTEAFDNARRDVAATLVGLGVKPENLTQFSTRPDRYEDTRPQRLTAQSMIDALKTSATRTKGGCLVYYTSHGNTAGVVLDVHGRMYGFSPSEMAVMLDEACPGRPAIVFISACYSGVFVPYLQGEQRMVVTAARSDRSSFGCSPDARYPFFDDCFLQSVGAARNFPALTPAIQACVARKEADLGLGPPSEPQVSIGAELRMTLSMMPFPAKAKGARSP